MPFGVLAQTNAKTYRIGTLTVGPPIPPNAGTGKILIDGLEKRGTRALLVTNWSVHSASARELITDLFRRQRADPALTRGEALRQAMMALLDGSGAVDSSGRTIYSYAHPLFWAPYSVIGDGGGT